MFQSQNIQKTTSPVYAGVKKNIAVAKNLEWRFSLSPACPRFQKAQRFIFRCKIGRVTGQNLIFFLTFWALNRLFRGWKQVSLCLVRNFVSKTFDGYGNQAYHLNGITKGPRTVGLKVVAICDRFPASFVCKMSFGSRSLTIILYTHTCTTHALNTYIEYRWPGTALGQKPLESVWVVLCHSDRFVLCETKRQRASEEIARVCFQDWSNVFSFSAVQ